MIGRRLELRPIAPSPEALPPDVARYDMADGPIRVITPSSGEPTLEQLRRLQFELQGLHGTTLLLPAGWSFEVFEVGGPEVAPDTLPAPAPGHHAATDEPCGCSQADCPTCSTMPAPVEAGGVRRGAPVTVRLVGGNTDRIPSIVALALDRLTCAAAQVVDWRDPPRDGEMRIVLDEMVEGWAIQSSYIVDARIHPWPFIRANAYAPAGCVSCGYVDAVNDPLPAAGERGAS